VSVRQRRCSPTPPSGPPPTGSLRESDVLAGLHVEHGHGHGCAHQRYGCALGFVGKPCQDRCEPSPPGSSSRPIARSSMRGSAPRPASRRPRPSAEPASAPVPDLPATPPQPGVAQGPLAATLSSQWLARAPETSVGSCVAQESPRLSQQEDVATHERPERVGPGDRQRPRQTRPEGPPDVVSAVS